MSYPPKEIGSKKVTDKPFPPSSNHHLLLPAQSSRVVKVIRLASTIYILCAILYTTSVSLIKPIVLAVFELPIIFKHSPPNVLDFSSHQSASFQVIPRLLPDHAQPQTVKKPGIKKTLRATSVDPDVIIAEDETSLWSIKHNLGSPSGLAKTQIDNARHTSTGMLIPPRTTVKGFESMLDLEMITWFPEGHTLKATPLTKEGASSTVKTFHKTSQDFFLSKAFGDSLGPSKIVPFYYKALGVNGTGHIEARDISITTLLTSNRFKVFSRLVEKYQGPISATVHVPDSPEILKPLLASLDDMYHSSPVMSTWVDIHLVIDSFDRQFNMWRNVAKFFARTDLVMMLDVDFWLCTDFRQRILQSPKLIDQLLLGKSAFVIPAFEYTKQSDGIDPKKFPRRKSDLMDLVGEGKIGMFHKSWQPGHGPTNYPRFYELKENEFKDVYRVMNYTHSYEPYVVYKKEGTPFCDERFIGYGGNKAACLFELYLSGVSFYVLPNDFLIHQSHAYAEKTRQHERKFNRKLYSDFRQEICFRYLVQKLESDSLPSATNMLKECQKIKGFTNAVMSLSRASGITIRL